MKELNSIKVSQNKQERFIRKDRGVVLNGLFGN